MSATLETHPGASPCATPEPIEREGLGQITLVLQGGGALGAYHAGVYEALQQAGLEPDWVIGTSIGAINGALIAGNHAADRVPRLREFWTRVTHDPVRQSLAELPFLGASVANAMTMANGIANFFTPNLAAFLGGELTPETAGYYSVAPLARTLGDLVDATVLMDRVMRLTVGAANLRTADMKYFDSRDMALTLQHVMASGALPPAFPAVRIGGELFWDGGILSNTPIEAVFDDNPRRSGIVFVVHIWHPNGPEPADLPHVLARYKDLQYSSRSSAQVLRQKQIHKLRHVIAELVGKLPEEMRKTAEVKMLAGYGCLTHMHVVRLLAPPRAGEDYSKDIDFSSGGIQGRWADGLADTRRVLSKRPWERPFDPMEGFILHETEAGEILRDS